MRDLKALNKGAFLEYLWLIINPFVDYVVVDKNAVESINKDYNDKYYDFTMYKLFYDNELYQIYMIK